MVVALAPTVDLDRAGGKVAKKTVLVVEDDQPLSELLVLLLETEGYVTVAARDGKSAVELAGQLRPSVITLDLGLPVMTGQRVLDELAAGEATQHIPVVVLSSDVDGLRPTRQVRHVLVKPLGISQLVEAVKASLTDDVA